MIVCGVRRGPPSPSRRARGTVTYGGTVAYDDGVVVAHCEETGREFATDWPLTARERDELLDVFCV